MRFPPVFLNSVDTTLEQAVSKFKQALTIDPDYAPAWLGLSWAYEYQRGGTLTYEQGAALAREAADRALAIDDSMALAWSAMSFLKKKYEWDWQGAQAAADQRVSQDTDPAEPISEG